ncbi:MAG: urea carboxylase-associated family protein [Actinomycetota bacterium]|nr:urea carboxylase-associated family protein [Actinomycetota bacterium]
MDTLRDTAESKILTRRPAGSTLVRPGQALAVTLSAGSELAVRDLEGQQVGDLVAFCAEDPTERFSPGNTRKLNRAYTIGQGAVLYSTKCRPLLTIIEDTVSCNDLLFSSCSPYDYPLRFGALDHANCLSALSDAVRQYGVPEYLIPDPLNIFQNTFLDLDSGGMETIPPRSQADSHMLLRAETDVLVAVSTCPQDLNPCNGGSPGPLQLTWSLGSGNTSARPSAGESAKQGANQ